MWLNLKDLVSDETKILTFAGGGTASRLRNPAHRAASAVTTCLGARETCLDRLSPEREGEAHERGRDV